MDHPGWFNQLAEVLEARHQHELLDEQLRVQHGNVGGPADEGVGRVGQRVVHVEPGQGEVGPGQHRGDYVVDHLTERKEEIC